METDVAITEPDPLILHYLTDVGARISNMEHFPPVSGFAIISARAIDHDDHDIAESYMARSLRVGRDQLIDAQSRSRISEMGEIMLSVVLIGLLPTLLIAAATGDFVALGARRKIDRHQPTLADLTNGQMVARMSLVPDDTDGLSDISNAVNTMAATR